MDAVRFDRLARSLANSSSRRVVLGIAFGGPIGAFHFSDAETKKRRKKKKKHKHRRCVADCTGKSCGSDGCAGSCGECDGDKTCQSGSCACPDGTEACGSDCLPRCPNGIGGAQIVRHPGTCQCCLRPNYFACGGGEHQECCGEPDSIPCCGHPCDPIAASHDCVEVEGACRYDVECADGRFCSGDIDPRTCEDIPAG